MDVELRLIANNQEYVKSIREAEQANQSLYQTNERNQKREKGLIEDIVDSIKDLEERRTRAWKVEDIEKYNQKIAEAKKDLKEYEKAGLDVDKSTEKQTKSTNALTAGLKKMVLGFATAAVAIKAAKAIMESTQKTGDFLRREILGIKTALGELSRSIATGNLKDLGKRLDEARQAGRLYANQQDYIGDRMRELTIREGDRKIALAELAKEYRNTGLSATKQAEAAEKYIDLVIEGEKEALELLELRRDSELKLASTMSGLTADEIKNNLTRAKYLQDNTAAVEKYRRAVSDLAFEEAGKTEQRLVGDELISVPVPGDIKLMAIYKTEIANTSDEIKKLSDEMLGWNLITDQQRTVISNSIAAVSEKRAEAVTSTVRANIKIQLARNEEEKAEKKDNEEAIKRMETFLGALAELQDEYELGQISRLEGRERIAAEEQYQQKQINALQRYLESLGALTQTQYTQLTLLRENAVIEAMRKEDDLRLEDLEKQRTHGERILGLNREILESGLELFEDNEKDKIQLRIMFLEDDRAALIKAGDEISLLQAQILDNQIAALRKKYDETEDDDSGFFQKLLGLDDDQMSAIKKGAGMLVDTIDEIFDARVKDAERQRELAETRISEMQRDIETEARLMEQGFANNLAAKQKELEALKVARDKALAEEERALKAQRILDTVTQSAGLITASADIFKGFSKIPIIGVPLAIAMIGTMFGAFGAAKLKARAASKLAKGGSGVVAGRLHSEGGERFGDHLEVERGEAWGVLSRGATSKYGKVFSEMVNGFNKDMIPMGGTNGDVTIDIDETNNRLNRLEYQLIKLNKNVGTKKEVQQHGNMRIEKIGNKTRIIRNV